MVGENMENVVRTKKGKDKNKKNKIGLRYYDFNLAFLILFACSVGLIIIYSASAYIAKSKDLESTYFLKRQLITIVVGFVLMVIFSFINYKWFKFRVKLPVPRSLRSILPRRSFVISLPWIMLVSVTVLQGYTSFFAPIHNGARRWIVVNGFTFQPSELAKFVVIIFGAYICSKKKREVNTFLGFIKAMLYITPLVGFILKENLSAAIIVAAIYGVIIFVNAKKTLPYFALVGITGIAVIKGVKFFGGYRSDRLEILENVETSEKGQQILQGLYAIASGGLFGKGLGGSEQKYGRVPEAYNDMIFTIICEEFGLFGGIAVILLFALILYRMFVVIMNAKDRFGALVGIGIMSQIGIQVVLNILVVTSIIPSTGVVLPFISFGGTAIIIMLFEIGIFLNISWKIEYKNRLLVKREERYKKRQALSLK